MYYQIPDMLKASGDALVKTPPIFGPGERNRRIHKAMKEAGYEPVSDSTIERLFEVISYRPFDPL